MSRYLHHSSDPDSVVIHNLLGDRNPGNVAPVNGQVSRSHPCSQEGNRRLNLNYSDKNIAKCSVLEI